MSLEAYHEAIERKRVSFEPRGFEPRSLHPSLKPHQAHCVEFAVRAGCAALFLDTGLGKTLCALDWAREVTEKTGKPVLMLAPLAVAQQHQREAERFDLDAVAIREPQEIKGARTYITNYDRLAKFDADAFGGVVLDESSILKSFTGKTTRDTVLSPFMGIGSEGYVALKMDRRFIGFELNPTYYAQATKHLEDAETVAASGSLLSLMVAA